ncbi:MAG: transposase, partial [Colwellia sp.]|nr:transposase [Colwellia sp.]
MREIWREVSTVIRVVYKYSDAVAVPDISLQKKISEGILLSNKLLSDAIAAVDGSHKFVKGRGNLGSLSWKYGRLPCYNIMFVVERLTETIIDFSLHPNTYNHVDATMFAASRYRANLKENFGEAAEAFITLADGGYANGLYVAAAPRGLENRNNPKSKQVLNFKLKNMYPDSMWKAMVRSRMVVERTFANFFYNKFTRLSHWT